MEEQEMFKELYTMTKENNRMLKAMRREAMIGRIISLLFWVSAIVIPLWYFYSVLLPQINAIAETTGILKGGESGGFQNTEAFRSFLETLGAAQTKEQ
jgi:hypothetical protein